MKLIAFIPLIYSETGQFWERDLGVVICALREMGHDAHFIALGEPSFKHPDKPLILCTREQAADPEWWKAHHADAIVINTWSAPRHHQIRLAALSAGCPVLEKLDTDGIKSPRIHPAHALKRVLVHFDLSRSYWRAIPGWIHAIAKFSAVYAFPSLLDRPMVRGMSLVPAFAAETPLACARVRRFLAMYNASPMPRVFTVSHPVNTGAMGFSSEDQKINQVISVGRWDDAVKGWPLLKRTARVFLKSHPDWKFVVVGGGAQEEGKQLETEFGGRFQMKGRRDHDSLQLELRKSKIYLLPSYSETFNIAGAEALCCGCSVVGPAQIPSSAYFAGKNSGTPSNLRSTHHICDALDAEVSEWNEGRRNPVQISTDWIATVGAKAVAEQYLKIFEELKGSHPRN